jgi:hypothetical protein
VGDRAEPNLLLSSTILWLKFFEAIQSLLQPFFVIALFAVEINCLLEVGDRAFFIA